jgi:hypothetical protein
MKKLSIILAVSLATSCSVDRHLIKQSDICITNESQTQVWFLESDRSKCVAKAWQDGLYGQALVQVLDTAEFLALEKRAVVRSGDNSLTTKNN